MIVVATCLCIKKKNEEETEGGEGRGGSSRGGSSRASRDDKKYID